MRFEKQSWKLEDQRVSSSAERSLLAQFYAKYPEIRRAVETLDARKRGFKDDIDLRRWERKLTPEELELWADGTKVELEAILARRSE